MHNKFIRHSFMLACASFVLSNAYAMETLEEKSGVHVSARSQSPVQNQWAITEKAEQHCAFGKTSSKSIKVRFLNNESYIENFTVAELENTNDIVVYIQFRPFSSEEMYSILKGNLKDVGAEWTATDCLKIFTDKIRPSKFFSVFYDLDLIPDFIIDRIVKHTGIDDFRMNTDGIIARINEQMTEESTAADFKKIAFEELATIKDPGRRAETTWGLVENIQESENFDRDLIIDLCGKIDSQDLPFFKEAMELRASLAFTDDALGKVSPQERYKGPIVDLLAISNVQEDKSNLNNLVKGFVYNDVPHAEFSTRLKKLQNLTFSCDSMFELLNIIREQELEIALLKGDKK